MIFWNKDGRDKLHTTNSGSQITTARPRLGSLLPLYPIPPFDMKNTNDKNAYLPTVGSGPEVWELRMHVSIGRLSIRALKLTLDSIA